MAVPEWRAAIAVSGLAEASDAQPSIVIAGHEVRGAGTGREVHDVNGIRAVIDDSLFVDRVDATPIVS